MSKAGQQDSNMKPSKKGALTPAEKENVVQKERARLLGERKKIVARLQQLQQQELASYIRAPYLDLSNALTPLP
jgi:hypothetical protein